MTAGHVRRTEPLLEQISGLFQLVDPKLGAETANTFSLANRFEDYYPEIFCEVRGSIIKVFK